MQKTLAGLALVVTVAACGRGSSPQGEQGDAAPPADSAWNVTMQPVATPAAANSAQPQLTSSPAGVILSWLEQSGATATLKFAERTSSGWSEPRTVTASDNWFVSWADVPTVMRMSDGTLVATTNPNIDPTIEAYELQLAWSRDNGKSWSAPITPHHDGTKTQHGFPSLFELPGPSLGLVWLDGRDQELNTADRDGGAMALYFAQFDRNWKQTAETAANTRVCECCPTSVAMTDEGPVTAFRDRSPREIRDINVSRLENGRWTDARPVHVDNWEIDACPVNGPALSARGREVVAAWFTAKDDKPRAYAAFSSDAGRTWGEPIRLDGESTLGHVDVEMLDDGSAVATWVEFAEQRSRLQTRRVERTGVRSRAVDVTPARPVGYPRLARRGNELVFAWTEGAEAPGNPEQVKTAVVKVQ